VIKQWKLPEGWQWTKLGYLVTVQYGKGLPEKQRRDGSVAVYGANGIIGFHDISLTKGQTIIIGRKGSAGAVNWSEVACWPIDTTFFIDEFPESVYPKFLYYFLSSQQLGRLQQSAAIPGLNRDLLYGIPVPLPYPDDPQRSLAEQRRIVARLEMMLTEVREMRAIIREMRKDVDRLMEAALEEVFPEYGQKLPGGWEWRPVKYVATETTRRNPRANVQSSQRLLTSPSENMLEQKRDGADIGFRYVEISSVDNRNCRIVLEKVKYILNKDAPGRARQVIHENDVIFATTRPYLKNIALIPNELNGEICSTGFCVLCPIPERIVPKFLFYAVRANSFVKQLLSRQKGATYPAITDEDVFANQIPLPYPNEPNRSKAVQHHIVAYLEAVEDEILSVQKLLDQDEQAVNQLEQSILEAAFRGEI
jgi:type I restriction enzyme S subunit